MLIRYIFSAAGPGMFIKAGTQIEVPDEEARKLIAAGTAEAVAAPAADTAPQQTEAPPRPSLFGLPGAKPRVKARQAGLK